MSDEKPSKTIIVHKEHQTAATWRYKEQTALGEMPVVGTMYFRKTYLAEIGDPDVIVVTIKPGD